MTLPVCSVLVRSMKVQRPSKGHAREVLDASTVPAPSSTTRRPAMRRVCPKCDVPLFILHFKDIEIDFCHHCRGLWLDAHELEALMKQTGANAHDPLLKFQRQTGVQPNGRPHLCPRCDAALHEIQAGRGGTRRSLDARHSINALADTGYGSTPMNCSSFSRCSPRKAARQKRSIT